MPDHRLRVDLRHPGRADHHRRGTGVASVPRVLQARVQPVGSGARDHRDASIDVLDDCLQYTSPFALRQPGDFAGDTQRGDAVDPGADEQIDDPLQALVVDFAGRSERRGQDGKYARKQAMRWHSATDMVHELKPGLTRGPRSSGRRRR